MTVSLLPQYCPASGRFHPIYRDLKYRSRKDGRIPWGSGGARGYRNGMRPTPSSALVVGRVVSSSLLVFGTRPPTFGARSARARARTHVRSGVRQVSAKKSFERDPPRAHANPKRRVGSFPSAPSPPGPTYCGPRLTPPLRRGPPLFPDKVEPVERAIRIPRPAVESHCGAIHVRAVG